MPPTVERKIVERQKLDDIDKPVVDLIEKFGFAWEADYRYPTPDQSKRIQIRAEEHLAPAAKVAEIRAAMRRNDPVPSIVVTADGYTVDGNTRTRAAVANKFPTMHAIVLDVEVESATEGESRRLRVLGAAFNARHGKNIDRNELRRAVDHISEDATYTATRIAALLGVTDATVNNIMAEKRAHDRASGMGFHVNGSLTPSKLRALGHASEVLHDEPFRQLFGLVQDSGMTQEETGELLKTIRKAQSDTEALSLIAHEREARREQVAHFKASGRSVPPDSGKLRRSLGFVLGFDGRESELIERNPHLAQEHIDKIEKAIAILEAVADAQEKFVP